MTLEQELGLKEDKNSWGQKQLIAGFDKLIKIGDHFLEVRLIKTQDWQLMKEGVTKFRHAQPRARFAKPDDKRVYYLVLKEDVVEMNEAKRRRENAK